MKILVLIRQLSQEENWVVRHLLKKREGDKVITENET